VFADAELRYSFWWQLFFISWFSKVCICFSQD